MPIFRVTLHYKVRGHKRLRRVTRQAEVADFTKLTRPMKQEIRDRFPSADFVTQQILRQAGRPTRKRKKAA